MTLRRALPFAALAVLGACDYDFVEPGSYEELYPHRAHLALRVEYRDVVGADSVRAWVGFSPNNLRGATVATELGNDTLVLFGTTLPADTTAAGGRLYAGAWLLSQAATRAVEQRWPEVQGVSYPRSIELYPLAVSSAPDTIIVDTEIVLPIAYAKSPGTTPDWTVAVFASDTPGTPVHLAGRGVLPAEIRIARADLPDVAEARIRFMAFERFVAYESEAFEWVVWRESVIERVLVFASRAP